MPRDTARAIARITQSGYGLDIATARAAWYVLYEGPQSVFVDDDGRVFCVPQGTSLMLRWIDSRRAQWVGNFTSRRNDCLQRTIRADLRERWHELRAAA